MTRSWGIFTRSFDLVRPGVAPPLVLWCTLGGGMSALSRATQDAMSIWALGAYRVKVACFWCTHHAWLRHIIVGVFESEHDIIEWGIGQSVRTQGGGGVGKKSTHA